MDAKQIYDNTVSKIKKDYDLVKEKYKKESILIKESVIDELYKSHIKTADKLYNDYKNSKGIHSILSDDLLKKAKLQNLLVTTYTNFYKQISPLLMPAEEIIETHLDEEINEIVKLEELIGRHEVLFFVESGDEDLLEILKAN